MSPRPSLTVPDAEGTDRVAMAAGETSGDLLAAAVLQGLAARSSCRAAGIGGPAMASQGFDCWWSIDELSVRGYAEVLAALPRLLRLRRQLAQRVTAWRPDVFVGVDAPDFNLNLEARLREQGVPVVHFISPSIWAWRAERIEKIRAAVDHMLLVFPFEPAIYRNAGIPATYVGHPLADVIPSEVDQGAARAGLGLDRDRATVALLPGSRPAEIRYMAELFLQTALWMQRQRGDLQFVLPAAGQRLFELLRERLARMRDRFDVRLTLVQGRSHDCLAAADTVLVASGTATLETALFRRPMVVAYRMAGLSYRLMKNKGYLPWVGLPNILAGETIVPEFIQDAARPESLGQALLDQLDDANLRTKIAARFESIHHELRRDCASRAAEVIVDVIKTRRSNAR